MADLLVGMQSHRLGHQFPHQPPRHEGRSATITDDKLAMSDLNLVSTYRLVLVVHVSLDLLSYREFGYAAYLPNNIRVFDNSEHRA